MKKRTTIKKWAATISLMILGVGMSACAMGGASWKEEVLLHDGTKLIADRSIERGGRHEIGQPPPIKEQGLSFSMPGTGQEITWEDHFSEDVGSANFLPMLLDISNGAAYLVAAPMGCLSYNKWGRPNPPYVIFKYQGKEWRRIPLQELPAGIKQPNMLHASPDAVAARSAKDGVVPATAIRKENEEYRQPEYKTILREALPESALCPDWNSPRYRSPKAPLPMKPLDDQGKKQ